MNRAVAILLVGLLALPILTPLAAAMHDMGGQPLTPPTIFAIEPASAPRGNWIDVTGANFSGMSAPNLDNAYSAEYSILSDSHLRFRVPPNTPDGDHTFYLSKYDWSTGQSIQTSFCCLRVTAPRALYVHDGGAQPAAFAPIIAEAGYSVEEAAAVPENISGYNLVVLQSYRTSTSLLPQLQSYVQNGGGLMLVAGAPIFLCGGRDLTCLGWMGSAQYINTGGVARVTDYPVFNAWFAQGAELLPQTENYYSQAALTNVGGSTRVVAKWTDQSAYGVEIYVGSNRASWLADIADGNADKHAYLVAALKWTMGSAIIPPPEPLGAPVLSVQALPFVNALSWTTAAGPVASYRVYYGTSADSVHASLLAETTSTSFEASTAQGFTWYYAVAAYDGATEGPLSNIVSVTSPVPPGPPQNARVAPGPRGYVDLLWDAPADDGGASIESYYFEAYVGSSLTHNGRTSALQSRNTVALPDGALVTFRVYASNGVGSSSFTEWASGETRQLAALVLEGAPGTLVAGGSAQLTASGVDQYGDAFPASAAWSADAGTIAADGTYTAPPAAGATVTITATQGAISATTMVTIVAGELDHIVVEGPAALVAGEAGVYSLVGEDALGNRVPLSVDSVSRTFFSAGAASVCWTESGVTGCQNVEVAPAPLASISIAGPASIVAGSSATYALAGADAYGNAVALALQALDVDAPTQAGAFTIAYEEQGVAATLEVMILAAPLASIVIEGPDVVVAGARVLYTLGGTDVYGNPVALAFDSIEYDAPTLAGAALVAYEEQGVAAAREVLVVADALAAIVVAGPDALVVGTTATYALQGADQYGNAVALAQQEITFTAPTQVGVASISYAEGDVTGVKDVLLLPGPLAAIFLDGPATLVAGESGEYTATGADEYGNSVPLASATFVFAAPTTAGPAAACIEEQGVVACIDVMVVPGPAVALDVRAPATEVNVGRSVQLSVVALDRYGNEFPVAVAWSTETGRIDANGRFTGLRVGASTVRAQAGDLSDSVIMVTSPVLTTQLELAATWSLGQAPSGSVHVAFLDGAPVVGAQVTVRIERSAALQVPATRTMVVTGETDADGAFRFDAPTLAALPGEYDVFVDAVQGENAGAAEGGYEVAVQTPTVPG